jgi:hypothetical protein
MFGIWHSRSGEVFRVQVRPDVFACPPGDPSALEDTLAATDAAVGYYLAAPRRRRRYDVPEHATIPPYLHYCRWPITARIQPTSTGGRTSSASAGGRSGWSLSVGVSLFTDARQGLNWLPSSRSAARASSRRRRGRRPRPGRHDGEGALSVSQRRDSPAVVAGGRSVFRARDETADRAKATRTAEVARSVPPASSSSRDRSQCAQ